MRLERALDGVSGGPIQSQTELEGRGVAVLEAAREMLVRSSDLASVQLPFTHAIHMTGQSLKRSQTLQTHVFSSVQAWAFTGRTSRHSQQALATCLLSMLHT